MPNEKGNTQLAFGSHSENAGTEKEPEYVETGRLKVNIYLDKSGVLRTVVETNYEPRIEAKATEENSVNSTPKPSKPSM